MAITFDNALGIHQQALELRSRRAELLANNIANADTPNFKARDIDFKAVLAAEQSRIGNTQLKTTSGRHIGAAQGSAQTDIQYRVPLQPSIDGNTVDDQYEMAAFAKNAMDFQASLHFLNSKITGLKNAIKGE